MCENDVFFLPVNILTVWRDGFLGRTLDVESFMASWFYEKVHNILVVPLY